MSANNKLKKPCPRRRLRAHLSVRAWQIGEIKRGLVEADQGDFATRQDVRRILGKWTGRKRKSR